MQKHLIDKLNKKRRQSSFHTIKSRSFCFSWIQLTWEAGMSYLLDTPVPPLCPQTFEETHPPSSLYSLSPPSISGKRLYLIPEQTFGLRSRKNFDCSQGRFVIRITPFKCFSCLRAVSLKCKVNRNSVYASGIFALGGIKLIVCGFADTKSKWG